MALTKRPDWAELGVQTERLLWPTSKPRPYWNPEQPPPSIWTRRTLTSSSVAMSSLIFTAAFAVRLTRVSVRSRISMRAL